MLSVPESKRADGALPDRSVAHRGSVGEVRLARRCGDQKQVKGSLESPQDADNELIPLTADGGDKSERESSFHVGETSQ